MKTTVEYVVQITLKNGRWVDRYPFLTTEKKKARALLKKKREKWLDCDWRVVKRTTTDEILEFKTR